MKISEIALIVMLFALAILACALAPNEWEKRVIELWLNNPPIPK